MLLNEGTRLSVLFIFILFLTACGGGGSSSKASNENIQIGTFIDSAVVNIRYETATQNGFTNDAGEFRYLLGESVVFSIGGVKLPSTPAKSLITPFDIADSNDPNNLILTNIARLLQSLDSDKNSSNGLQIPQEAHEFITSLNINFDSETFEEAITPFIQEVGVFELLSDEDAISHLLKSVIRDGDYDEDGITNEFDNCILVLNNSQSDSDNDGAGDLCDLTPLGSDSDNDNIPDVIDNCINTSNNAQLDSDNDGAGDLCDNTPLGPDFDDDGIPNHIDNCVNQSNESQVDYDNDGIGDVCDQTPFGPDSDNDGTPDDSDNCINDSNANQADFDKDGLGDICDSTPFGPDIDSDGVTDSSDNCVDTSNSDQMDKDHDEIGDLCDSSPLGNDSSAPIAKIAFPPRYSISKSSVVTIRGNASDETYIDQVLVNGQPVNTQDGYLNWSMELSLEPGLHDIFVETSDSLNSDQNSDSIQIQIAGPAIINPGDIAVDKENNRIYWLDAFGPILSADLSTKQRTSISKNANQVSLSSPYGLALDTVNKLAYISDSSLDGIVKFNLLTGDASLLSKCSVLLPFPDEIVFDQAGRRLLVSDAIEDHVVSVNIDTGACSTLFSRASNIKGLAWNPNEKIIYFGNGSLYSFDEKTSQTTYLSDAMLSPYSGHVKHAVFDSENNRLIWLSGNDFDDTDGLYFMNMETNEVSVISTNQVQDEATKIGFTTTIDISPDGQSIYMMAVSNQSLLSIDIATGEHSVLLSSLQTDRDQGPDIIYPTAIDTDEEYAYVLDGRRKAVMKMELNTGDRDIYLESETSFSEYTQGIEKLRVDREDKQLFLMIDNLIPGKAYDTPAFVKVDIETEQQTIISSSRDFGDEPYLLYASDFVLDKVHNRLLALDTGPDEIVAVDILTGDRSIFSGEGIPNSEREFRQINNAVLDSKSNRLLVSDSSDSTLVSVDLETGSRSLFSERTEMRGLYAIDNRNHRLFSLRNSVIYQIDLVTKAITTISDWSSSSATNRLVGYKSMTYSEENNMLYVADNLSQAIFVIDVITGSRMILAD
jgi:sugar lactone lactonase YvrE